MKAILKYLFPLIFVLVGVLAFRLPPQEEPPATMAVVNAADYQRISVLENGDFSAGDASWWFAASNGAEGTFDATTGEGCLTVIRGGGNVWDVQLGQNNLNLVVGERYEIAIRARTIGAAMPLALKIGTSSDASTHSFKVVEVGDISAEFIHTYVQPFTDDAAYFAVQVGGHGTGQVCVDDISVEQIVIPPPLPTPEPTTMPRPDSRAEHGRVMPHLWPNGAQSALSLTFDDGFHSQYDYVRPILNNYHFPSTFYVTGGLSTGTWRAGTWEQFREIDSDGHEIGSHTWAHQNLSTLSLGDTLSPGTIYYELNQINQDIDINLYGKPVISFAYPYVLSHTESEIVAAQYYQSGRVAGNQANSAHASDINWMQIAAYSPLFADPRNTPDDDLDELAKLQTFIQEDVINAGDWGIVLLHEVLPFEDIATIPAWHPASTEWFIEFSRWLQPQAQAKTVWVNTVGNVTRYIKERDAFEAVVLRETDSQIDIVIADGLDDAIFDFPLSVDITVPQEWNGVYISQGGAPVLQSSRLEGGDWVISAEIIPDRGTIILSDGKYEPTSVTLQPAKNNNPLLNWTLLIILSVGLAILTLYFYKQTQHQFL